MRAFIIIIAFLLRAPPVWANSYPLTPTYDSDQSDGGLLLLSLCAIPVLLILLATKGRKGSSPATGTGIRLTLLLLAVPFLVLFGILWGAEGIFGKTNPLGGTFLMVMFVGIGLAALGIISQPRSQKPLAREKNSTGARSKEYSGDIGMHRKAAELGDAAAQNILAMAYYDGNGVTRNYEEAYFWKLLSSAKDREDSILDLNSFENKLSPEQISSVQRRALEWKPKTLDAI